MPLGKRPATLNLSLPSSSDVPSLNSINGGSPSIVHHATSGSTRLDLLRQHSSSSESGLLPNLRKRVSDHGPPLGPSSDGRSHKRLKRNAELPSRLSRELIRRSNSNPSNALGFALREGTGVPPRGQHIPPSGSLSPTNSPQLLAQSLKVAEERLKQQQKAAEENKIGDFSLLSPLDGSGFSYHALHNGNQKIYTCQVLSRQQYEHLVRVTQRVNTASPADWPYDDALEMRQRLLPADSQVIKHKDGRFYRFVARHYGSLHSYVQTKQKLDEDDTRRFFVQIVRVVAFCHALGIVVRDLKLRKFVFADEKQTHIQLSSVNDLVVLTDRHNDRLTDRHGCPAYVSPEVLNLHQKHYSGKGADVWSLGVLLFVMLVGRYPFYDSTPAGLFGKIRQGLFWIPPEHNLSLNTRCMVRGLLKCDPEDRPTAWELLALPWLQPGASAQGWRGAVDGSASRSSEMRKKLGVKRLEEDDQMVPCLPEDAFNGDKPKVAEEDSVLLDM